MYFTVGWPKILDLNVESSAMCVFCNRDRSLFAAISAESLSVWFVRPCVETTNYKRSQESLENEGINYTAEWRPDSSIIAVATNRCFIMFYYVEVDDSVKGLYEQFDSKIAGLRRESAELFVREKIPPVSLVLGRKLELSGNVCSLVCIRDELMATSDNGHIWRIQWDGVIIEDFSFHVSRIPFCIDHQQTKGVYLNSEGLYINGLEYSPLIGGFSIILSNGRAAFLTASTLKFNPNKVIGIFAQDISDATCTAINHRYRLIAYGLRSAEGVVVSFDDLTGALQITHRLVLSPKDFPDATSAAGAVSNLKWSPDGGVLAMTWEKGGIAVWSVFGALIMCSLGWDYGVADVMKHITKVKSMEWGPEGYNLWIISEQQDQQPQSAFPIKKQETKLAILQFAKSVLTVNSAMAGQECIFLQAEDRLFMSCGSQIQDSTIFSADQTDSENNFLDSTEFDQLIVGNKQWIIVPIPYSYLGNNWPVRYAAVDSSNENMVIAGRSGLAHYSLTQRRWKLFGSETQEKDFIAMGGLLWYEDQIIVGCFNLRDLRDEIRIYCRENKLDNQYSQTVEMTAQVLQLSTLKDRLLCFCADSHLSIFQLERKSSSNGSALFAVCLQELDVSNIVFHPACVISALLTSVCTETGHCHSGGDENILLNVCGRLLLLQKEPTYEPLDNVNNNTQVQYTYGAPTVLASCVENVWVCCHHSKDTPHLTEALWIACGARGMRVWLPLYPCDGEKHRAHNFMSKRIMLPVELCIYPLAVLYEDAVIVGAENEAALFSTSSNKKQPFCMITRTSQVYLHHILRQLLKRNLGYHAWEIAQSCATLPYFPHSLELLLHEVLEEEATSSEPIPDALLPRVIDFIQEFPVFLQTVVQCTRKTELALWPYLFAAVGNPKSLFQACLLRGELETAASYVIILQNLELPSVSQQYATTLLDNALEAGKFQLANDLVRFLKAIGDNELPPRSIGVLGKCGFPQITPPVTPTEEDLSFVLGTVSLNRGRSHSTAVSSKLSQIPSELNRIAHHEIGRTVSDSSHISRQRRISEPTVKAIAEKSFVEGRIISHAQKLLKDGKLKDLGNLAAHMDFELIAFFSKERNDSAHVVDFVKALRGLHYDFKWPYPSIMTKPLYDSTQKVTDINLCDEVLSCDIVNASEKHQGHHGSTKTSNDSLMEANKADDVNSSINSLETPTTDCQLVPKTYGEEMILLDASETGSLWTEESHTTCDDDFWTNQLFPQFDQTDEQHIVSRHLNQTELKLRYLLHLLLEAGCLEWGVVVSILLLDVVSVVQIFGFAERPTENEDTLSRLKDGLQAIRTWAETECNAYLGIIHAIYTQVIRKRGDTSLPSLQRVPKLSFPEMATNPSFESVTASEPTVKETTAIRSSISAENLSLKTNSSNYSEQKSECVVS